LVILAFGLFCYDNNTTNDDPPAVVSASGIVPVKNVLQIKPILSSETIHFSIDGYKLLSRAPPA
jgi:hypothetical protein